MKGNIVAILSINDYDLSGRVGIIAWVVKQSSVNLNQLRGAVLRKTCQHVVVWVVIDECEWVHRGTILE